MTTLLKANNLHSSRLKIGQHLRIPYRTTKYVLLKKGQSVQNYYSAASGNNQMILHELLRGETLSKVSKRYNVPVELIIQWNDIDDVRRIQAGKQLALYLDQSASFPETGMTITENTNTVITLSDSKKHPAKGTTRVYQKIASVSYYKVRNGDSLWSIARKFRISTGDIRRWNGLHDNMIHPGTRLVIKKS
jgi:membrane-bound lytic murein transglycosylase D